MIIDKTGNPLTKPEAAAAAATGIGTLHTASVVPANAVQTHFRAAIPPLVANTQSVSLHA